MLSLTRPLLIGVFLASLVTIFLWQQRRLTQVNQYLKQAQSHIAALQSQIDQAQHAVQTVTKYIDRVQIVREHGTTLIQQVPNYVSEQDNAACVLPDGVIRLHNAAAHQVSITNTERTYASPSGVALSTFASTVTSNYSRCHENAEQLIALQKLIAPLRIPSDEQEAMLMDGQVQTEQLAAVESIQ